MPIRFVFAIHNHQPVGNFDNVFEGAYRDSYKPFLELLEHYPEIPIALHTSGCLMEWLVERHPEYLDRLKRLVGRGQVEILGGGFYEPVLPMIPSRDRVGQIRTYRTYLEKLLHTKVRGMWVPERVWEQNLVSDIAAAGIEYTVLDDFHFKQAGLEEHQLFGWHLSEDDGRLVRIFPGSERIRYLVPFHSIEETVHYFGEVASKHPDAVVVFADDGEKFGSWPGTNPHCYQNGWLWRFFDMLKNNRHWIRSCTFSQALDETPSAGKICLPDCSYREMTEWALPPARQLAYQNLMRSLEHDHRNHEIRRFVRGGYWRNFRIKYPEADLMYARMLQISRRLQQVEAVNPDAVAAARQELYRAQCNCPWWHGSFGGLYLPHLRNAVYHHLIAADNALQVIENRSEAVVSEIDDLNLDGAPEVCLSNRRLAAFFNPHLGGCLYELDLRVIRHNLLATLARRPEAYHETIRQHGDARAKQAGLDRLIQYDPHMRLSLIDHFYDGHASVHDLAAGRAAERGDFATGKYEHSLRRNGPDVILTLARAGHACGANIRLTKEITVRPGSDQLEIRYQLENLPRDHRFHFAVELNFAGMAAGAEDRYFYYDGRPRAGQLQTLQDLHDAERLGLVDEWRGLDASVRLSRRGGIWAFPIQSVSQSEGGFELVHQSTAVLPHWHVAADHHGRWEVTLELMLDVSRVERRLKASA